LFCGGVVLGSVVYIAAEQVTRDIEQQSKKRFLPIVGPEKGTVLTRVICETKPIRVLEVGTLIGYSAILMGKDLPANAEIVTIEIHADEALIAKENIQCAQIPSKVEVLVGDAKKVISELTGFFDMAFIDAEKTEYLTYLQLAEPKLLVGSVVVADNAGIFADQMSDYLTYVRSSGNYKSSYEFFGEDGVEVSIKL
jgi:predicted O-methyltransferase YrrM